MLRIPLVALALLSVLVPRFVGAQAPGVPIIDDLKFREKLAAACEEVRKSAELVPWEKLSGQLDRRSCDLALPAVQEKRLSPSEIWEAARKGSVHLVLYYRCPRCDHWHVNVAGGTVLTADGAVATCRHVIASKTEMREGYLFAVSWEGKAWPVTDVLAANAHSDLAIVRAKGEGLAPLALNVASRPGDSVFCLSNPGNRYGMFTSGQISRFFWRDAARHRSSAGDGETGNPPAEASSGESAARVFMAVTLDYAGGSSGSPILDDRGNAVSLVQSTEPIFWDSKHTADNHQMTLHQASTAREVKEMIQRK